MAGACTAYYKLVPGYRQFWIFENEYLSRINWSVDGSFRDKSRWYSIEQACEGESQNRLGQS